MNSRQNVFAVPLRRALFPSGLFTATASAMLALWADRSWAQTPSLAEALDQPALTFTTAGDLPWTSQVAGTHDGTDAIRSGAITASETSEISTIVTGPGRVSFWSKVSISSMFHSLQFSVDGEEQATIETEDWHQVFYTLAGGSHTLKWTYTTHYYGIDSYGWVDQLSVDYFAGPPEIVLGQNWGFDEIWGADLADGGEINFGAFAVGSSTSLPFTIRNVGGGNLTGLAISKDGTEAADFTIGSLGTTTLGPGASTSFNITFAPGGVGTRSAAIHIASNDADENPFDLPLSGTGLVSVPEIAVEQPAGSALYDGIGNVAFAAVPGGSQTKMFTIRNVGTANLADLAITKDGANSADFTVGTLSTTMLAPGANTTFTVAFAGPVAVGTRTAAIHIASNDANENPFDIALSGTNPSPEITVVQAWSDLSDNSGSVAFEAVLGSSQTKIFTIRNAGNADLAELALTKDGTNPADFTIGPLGTTTLAPGTSTTFNVMFLPTAMGTRTAMLHIASNDADENPFEVRLVGNLDLAEALDQPGLVISGNSGWWPVNYASHDGLDCAHGDASGYGSSSLSIVVAGPGPVSFWWDPYMQAYLRFLVDGRTEADGYFAGWEQVSTVLGPGSHLLTWELTFSGTFPEFGASAALDQLELPGTTPRQLYDSWAAANGLAGLSGEPLASPHGDGVENLLKYAFNLNATAPDTRRLVGAIGVAGLPSITLDQSGLVLRFEYLRRKGSGLIYTPLKSADLINWLPLTATPVESAIPTAPDWERITIAEPCDPGVTPVCFGRVAVEMPEP